MVGIHFLRSQVENLVYEAAHTLLLRQCSYQFDECPLGCFIFYFFSEYRISSGFPLSHGFHELWSFTFETDFMLG